MKTGSTKDIITLPDERLRQSSEIITKIDSSTKALIRKMTEAALDWEKNRPHEVSTALAAVQIGELKSVIIVREDFEDRDNKTFVPLINPVIVKQGGKLEEDFEGCLSVPDYYGKITRSPKIKVKAKNIDGETIFVKAEGFLARTLQHEIDHINGITFVDHIKNDKDAFYKLTSSGELEKVDYDKEIKSSSVLWD